MPEPPRGPSAPGVASLWGPAHGGANEAVPRTSSRENGGFQGKNGNITLEEYGDFMGKYGGFMEFHGNIGKYADLMVI